MISPLTVYYYHKKSSPSRLHLQAYLQCISILIHQICTSSGTENASHPSKGPQIWLQSMALNNRQGLRIAPQPEINTQKPMHRTKKKKQTGRHPPGHSW